MSNHLYVGIDIGKFAHSASLRSQSLLRTQSRSLPALPFENSRAGFGQLLQLIGQYATPGRTHVLLERTGHYGVALIQYLQEHRIKVYIIQATKRYKKNKKTDKVDAQSLATKLYNKLELGAESVNEAERIAPLIPPSPTAQMLRGLVRHRYELMQECVQRRNKLTAILDELFPEFTQVYHGPNSESALALREKYPTPEAIAKASLAELCETRLRHLPKEQQIERLQELARTTIGTKDEHRRYTLLLEQSLLITELKLLNEHCERLEAEIDTIIKGSREGRILSSFIGVSSVQAALLLSGIGCIANFASVAKLRNYLGWSPKESQTGVSYDSTSLAKTGNPLLKQTMYMVAMCAIKYDPSWRALYQRLVERKCNLDQRTGKYRGKMKVLGRIAGQIIKVMYVLLRRDYELVQKSQPGGELPEPELYSVEKHTFVKAGGKHAQAPTGKQAL